MITRNKDGWEGSRSSEYTGNSDCFRKAFKEAGIKGVFVKKSYYDAFRFTIKFDKSEIIPKSEYLVPLKYLYGIKIFDVFYIDGIYEYIEKFRKEHPTEDGYKEFDRVHHILSDEFYEACIRNDIERVLNEKGVKKLEKIKSIVNDFNYDYSDTMTDYFDRGFCDFYECKAVSN